MTEAALPRCVCWFVTGAAIHEGRAVWRPVLKFGRTVVAQHRETRTNRRDAVAMAREIAQQVREQGIAGYGC